MTIAFVATALAVGALLASVSLIAVRVLRRAGRIESVEDAAAAAEGTLPGFVVAGAVLGADASGALAVSGDGRIAAVRRIGSRYRIAEVPWRSVRSTPRGS